LQGKWRINLGATIFINFQEKQQQKDGEHYIMTGTIFTLHLILFRAINQVLCVGEISNVHKILIEKQL
jgi:hypothetical protein